MRAIILAAGMGTRLGQYTKNLPKCMLSFAGKTLIERQIEVLRSSGVGDIVVVGGYRADAIAPSNYTLYINKMFGETNMVESLFCAEREMTNDLLVCYGDIIYEKNVLDVVLNSSWDIGVTVDTDYWEYWSARLDEPREDVESLVVDGQGAIIELGDPRCSLERAEVRYVGLLKFSKKGLSILKEQYHMHRERSYELEKPWYRSKSFKKAYMTCMLQAIIESGYTVMPIRIDRGWLEFDTATDYERASAWHAEGSLGRFIHLAESP